MTSDNSPQDPKGYYYAPLTEGGPYQQKLEKYFSNAGLVINYVIAAAKGLDPQLGGIPDNAGSKMGGMLGNTVGFYVDNVDNIEMNIHTFIEQTNNPDSWMIPQPFDNN